MIEIPDLCVCEQLYDKYKVSDNIKKHSFAVAKKALLIADSLSLCNVILNKKLINSAAILHDIAKGCRNHAEEGANWIYNEGYPAVAIIIYQHHWLYCYKGNVSEVEVVYLADKLVKEDKEVTLEERFSFSIDKCTSNEAITSHNKRYNQALYVQNQITKLLKGASL